MKHSIRISLLALILWPAFAFAQAQPATTQYPEWDQLTPEQRDALITPLRERWNGNPDERPQMIERAQRWKTMPRDQRDRARHGMQRWEHMSPEQRTEARALFHAKMCIRDSHVTAGGIARAQEYRDETQRLFQGGIGVAEHHHRADQDDAVDEVGTRHQRGMQDHRYPRDDHVAGDGRQHEDVQRHEAVAHDPPPSCLSAS